jgi:large subunit ribosomal protein L25
MAEAVTLAIQPRTTSGTHKARQLRRKGLIPAVVYGHKEATVHVTVPAEDFTKMVRHGTRVLDLQADGKTEKVLIRELQFDHLGKDILHADFARISADERVVVEVRLELRGTAPGVTAGGVLDQPLHSIEIECLAISMPESIRVNIGELQIGGIIHVSDLKLPEGVKAMTDADAIVVHVTQPAAEAAAPAEAGEQAEPEVIGRQKAEEEEAE